MSAARTGDPAAEKAIEKLCEIYWYPLYAFIRGRGRSSEEAQDLTQEFFLKRVLEKNALERVTIEGGKFRSYLLTILKHFLADEYEHRQTQKRGGGRTIISLDAGTAETRYLMEPVDNTTPDRLFERRCTIELLDKVRNELRNSYDAEGNATLFDALRPCLTGDEHRLPYANIGTELNLSEGAVKTAVHRLRKRYGQLLRAKVAETVGNPEDVDSELRHLAMTCG